MAEADEEDRGARASRAPGATRVLCVIQGVLIVSLVSLALVRREAQYWPIVTWPVYAMARPSIPLGSGTWLVQDDLLANLMLERSVTAASQGLWVNPLAPWIAATPSVYRGMQLGVLVFEACFFVVLFGRSARNLVLAIALVFHAMNALFMVVTFTPVLIVYAMFFDREALRSRVRSHLPASLGSIRVPEVSAKMAVGLAWALALATALAWHGGLARWFNFFGLVDWQTPWLVILPLALASIGLQTRALLKPSSRAQVGQAS